MKNLKIGKCIGGDIDNKGIKLSSVAMQQHNKIVKLQEQNELLLNQISKCKGKISQLDRDLIGTDEKIQQYRKQLNEIQKLNNILQEKQNFVQEKTILQKNHSQSISHQMMQLKICNQRIKAQIESFKKKNIEGKQKQEMMRKKIQQKQQIYEKAETQVHFYQVESQNVQKKIQEICRQIKKLEQIMGKNREK